MKLVKHLCVGGWHPYQQPLELMVDGREDQAVTLRSLTADEPNMKMNRGTSTDSKHKARCGFLNMV
jgi:hypothetical protein